MRLPYWDVETVSGTNIDVVVSREHKERDGATDRLSAYDSRTRIYLDHGVSGQQFDHNSESY